MSRLILSKKEKESLIVNCSDKTLADAVRFYALQNNEPNLNIENNSIHSASAVFTLISECIKHNSFKNKIFTSFILNHDDQTIDYGIWDIQISQRQTFSQKIKNFLKKLKDWWKE